MNANETQNPAKKQARGFAVMDAQRVREIASNAGKSAHLKGTAHEFTSEEARAAGRKGGRVRAERARLRRLAESEARTVQTNT